MDKGGEGAKAWVIALVTSKSFFKDYESSYVTPDDIWVGIKRCWLEDRAVRWVELKQPCLFAACRFRTSFQNGKKSRGL